MPEKDIRCAEVTQYGASVLFSPLSNQDANEQLVRWVRCRLSTPTSDCRRIGDGTGFRGDGAAVGRDLHLIPHRIRLKQPHPDLEDSERRQQKETYLHDHLTPVMPEGYQSHRHQPAFSLAAISSPYASNKT